MEILIADDAKLLRDILIRFINQIMEAHIREAENGKEALEILEKHPEIELLFVDWRMPKMDGIDLIKEVRKSRSPTDLKIIMVSSYGHNDQISEALEAGANKYIVKPFGKLELCEKIADLGFSLRC